MEGLATTCWLLYADQESGLGPDEVVFARWPIPKKPATALKGGWNVWGSNSISKIVIERPDLSGYAIRGRWSDIISEWREVHIKTPASQGGMRYRKENEKASHSSYLEQYKDVPPGVRNGVPLTGVTYDKKDYWLRKPNYELRPEVYHLLIS